MKKTHYKSLFKATSLFGLVEIIRMALKVITNMGASYFLGSNGFGLVGLIENTTQLITSFTNFGINFTGVREIAAIKDRKSLEFHKAIKIINLFCLITGCLAGGLSIIAASYLSFLTFESHDYYLWFVVLSAYFVFTSAAQSKIIFLEGIQNLSKLIRINILINISNTVVILSTYYYFGVNGIIVAMVLNSLISFFLYSRLSNIPKSNVSISSLELRKSLKKLAKSGGILSVNLFIGFFCFYLIRLYFKGVDTIYLSYHHAGTIVLVSYLGMIFIATGKFFFPRLTRIIEEKDDYNLLINHQLEICLLLILPAVLIVYSFGEFLVTVLFSSEEFKPVYQILIYGLAANVFKGFNHSTGYLFLSNKNYKQYFLINAFSDIANIFLTIFLFQKMGLYGIGLALLLNYLLCAVYTYIYIKNNYLFRLNSNNSNLIFISLGILTLIISAHFYLNDKYFSFVSVLLTLISLFYSGYKLDEYILNQKVYKAVKSFLKFD